MTCADPHERFDLRWEVVQLRWIACVNGFGVYSRRDCFKAHHTPRSLPLAKACMHTSKRSKWRYYIPLQSLLPVTVGRLSEAVQAELPKDGDLSTVEFSDNYSKFNRLKSFLEQQHKKWPSTASSVCHVKLVRCLQLYLLPLQRRLFGSSSLCRSFWNLWHSLYVSFHNWVLLTAPEAAASFLTTYLERRMREMAWSS